MIAPHFLLLCGEKVVYLQQIMRRIVLVLVAERLNLLPRCMLMHFGIWSLRGKVISTSFFKNGF